MKKFELDFDMDLPVWFMYNNAVYAAKIKEVRIKDNQISYWFWWQDIVTNRKDFDLKIHSDNTFEIKIESLFETKKDLINSL